MNRLGGRRREVDQQNVTPGNRPLDPWNQHDIAGPGILAIRLDIQLPVVQRDGDGIVAQLGHPVHQPLDRVGHEVLRIVGRMRVQLDFEHPYDVSRLPHTVSPHGGRTGVGDWRL